MNQRLTAGVVALAVLALLIPALTTTAAAQSTNATATPTPSTTAEQIDKNTELLRAKYNEETGEAVITLKSDIIQNVVISDAGAFMKGGEVRQRSVILRPGEKTTIKMPVTKVDGYTGVSIATQKTLYAVPIETSLNLFSGSATWSTVQTAAVGGAFGVITLTGVIAWRMRRGGRDRTRRVA